MSAQEWLAKIIDHEVDEYWVDARNIVANFAAENPGEPLDILVNRIIESKARLAAFVGLGTGALQAIPAVGQAVAVGILIPEAIFLAKMQVDIALVLSIAYRQKLTKIEAKAIIVTCLILGLGADFIKNELRIGAIKITTRIIEMAIERMGEQALIQLLERIGIQAAKGGILKRVPIFAIPLSATMNYGQIEAFGWVVKKFLSPSFIMCGSCSFQTGQLNRFCPSCGASFL